MRSPALPNTPVISSSASGTETSPSSSVRATRPSPSSSTTTLPTGSPVVMSVVQISISSPSWIVAIAKVVRCTQATDGRFCQYSSSSLLKRSVGSIRTTSWVPAAVNTSVRSIAVSTNWSAGASIGTTSSSTCGHSGNAGSTSLQLASRYSLNRVTSAGVTAQARTRTSSWLIVRIETVGASANGSVVIQSSGSPWIAGWAAPTSKRTVRAAPNVWPKRSRRSPASVTTYSVRPAVAPCSSMVAPYTFTRSPGTGGSTLICSVRNVAGSSSLVSSIVNGRPGWQGPP